MRSNDPDVPDVPDGVDIETWRIIAAKKRLEYQYAREHLDPAHPTDDESEGEFRQRVRDALSQLSPQTRRRLRQDKHVEFLQIRESYAELNAGTTPDSYE